MRRQPVVPRLNPFTSLTAGLSDVWVGSSRGGTLKKAVRPTLVGSATEYAAGAGGFGVRMTASGGANSGLKITDNADELFGMGSANTIFVVRRCLDTTARNSLLFGYGNTPSGRILCHAPYSDGNLYFDFENATAGSGRVSVAYTKDTDLETLIFVAGPRKGREVWRRGVRIAQDTGATASRTSNTSGWGIGSPISSDGTDNVEVYMIGVATREWSDAECASFGRDPWQLFAQAGPLAHLFSTVSASGDFTAILTDAASLSDSISAVLGIYADGADAMTLADSGVAVFGATAADSEVASLDSAQDGVFGAAASATESMTLADAVSAIYGAAAALEEALTIDASQDGEASGAYAASQTDSTSLDASAAAAFAAYPAISESLALADAISGAMAAGADAGDALALDDAATRVLGLFSQASEASALGDLADSVRGVTGGVTEALTAADAQAAALSSFAGIDESMTLSELAASAKGYAVAIVAALALLEALRSRLDRAFAASGARGGRPALDTGSRGGRAASTRLGRTDSSRRTRH